MNVASAEAPATDDYVIARLREAKIEHVRLAISNESVQAADTVEANETFTERFLSRLLDEGMDVLVALVPTRNAARKLANDAGTQTQWRSFVRRFLARYAERIPIMEVGNAPNRPRWSGYSPRGYLTAWRIVAEEAAALNVKLAGPNISDFEPIFNAALLRSMCGLGRTPHIQTDNLFVERAKQPEAEDPSAVGQFLSRTVHLNLLKKVRILAAIGDRYSVPQLFCTYTCWTRPRLGRWTIEPRNKGADYLARYLVICAASNVVDRVYWGPLVDGRDGLIDCGDREYPDVDNVAHYRQIRGTLSEFERSPSFEAFTYMSALLSGARCVQAVSAPNGLQHFVFEKSGREFHVCYTLDTRAVDIRALYACGTADAEVHDARGRSVPFSTHRGIARERPLIFTWQTAVSVPTPSRIRDAARASIENAAYDFDYSHYPVEMNDGSWRAAAYVDCRAEPDTVQPLHPDALLRLPATQTLRDKRNKLWTVSSPIDDAPVVVKLNRTTGMRRLSYLARDSKAKRHWNNANEMLRRGVSTPAPIAFFERTQQSGVRQNIYVSAYVADTFSTRDLFTAFARGEDTYAGRTKSFWLERVAAFVGLMHKRRIIHRDLSSGNLLIAMEDGEPKIYVIDIGRATVDAGMQVLKDLNRICYKLSAEDQETFIGHYQRAYPKARIRGWRLSLWSFRTKQQLKSMLKGRKRRRRAQSTE